MLHCNVNKTFLQFSEGVVYIFYYVLSHLRWCFVLSNITVLFCLIYLFCLSGFLLLPKKSNNCPRMQQNSLTLDKHTKKICINKSLPFKSIVNSSWKHTSKIQMGIKHCSTNFNNFIFFISQLYWSEWYCQRKITRKKRTKGFIDIISDSENESKAKPYSKKGVNMHFTENI